MHPAPLSVPERAGGEVCYPSVGFRLQPASCKVNWNLLRPRPPAAIAGLQRLQFSPTSDTGHNPDVLPTLSASPPKSVWAVLDVLRWTTAHFEKHGLASARLDAELLAAHAFGMSRIELYAHFDRPLAAAELASYRDLVSRRLAGEPVAYLLGHKEFWSLDLLVDPRVLIPRPDSETLVEEALDRAGPGARIADVGTGSGALALALAKARPEAQVFATDISSDALAVARANAERLGLAVTFLQGDLVSAASARGRFDLIVANLPYIPSADIDGLLPMCVASAHGARRRHRRPCAGAQAGGRSAGSVATRGLPGPGGRSRPGRCSRRTLAWGWLGPGLLPVAI